MSKSLWFLSWLVFVLPAHAALRNVTIDDTVPDTLTGKTIVYDPAGAWSSGADCVQCTAHPSESQLFNGTWHDSTFNVQPGSNDFPNTPLSATATFTGTAVYVICALALTTTSPSGNSDMSFFLDNQLVGTFGKPAPGTSGYEYNVTVYSNASIPSGFHTLRIQSGHINGPKSLILLDRIVYTTDIEEEHSSSKAGIIAGSVVGVVVGVAALALAAFFLIRYRRGLKDEDIPQVNAFPATKTPILPGSPPSGSYFPSTVYTSNSNSGPLNTSPGHAPFGPSTQGLISPNRRDDEGFNPYDNYQQNAGYTVGSNTKTERIHMQALPTNSASESQSGNGRHMQSPSDSQIQPSSAGSVFSSADAPPAYNLSEAGSSGDRRLVDQKQPWQPQAHVENVA